MTSNPARPCPVAGVYLLESGHFDEALAETDTAQRPYVAVIDASARQSWWSRAGASGR